MFPSFATREALFPASILFPRSKICFCYTEACQNQETITETCFLVLPGLKSSHARTQPPVIVTSQYPYLLHAFSAFTSSLPARYLRAFSDLLRHYCPPDTCGRSVMNRHHYPTIPCGPVQANRDFNWYTICIF